VKAPFPIVPGATPLPEQTGLMRRARAVIRGGAPAEQQRLVMLETGAPLDEVAKYFATALGKGSGAPASVTRSAGDFARDEEKLTPLLEKLGQPFTHGARGGYQSVEINAPGGPRVSLQRPYRDFVGDRIVEKTLIVLSD